MPLVANNLSILDFLLEESLIEYLRSAVSNKPKGGFQHADERSEPEADYVSVKATMTELEPMGPDSAARTVRIEVEYRAGEEVDVRVYTARRASIHHALFDVTNSDLTEAGSHDCADNIHFLSDEREFDGDVRVWRRMFEVTAAEVDPEATTV